MIKKKLALFTMLCATLAGNTLQATWQKKARSAICAIGGLGAAWTFGITCAAFVEYRNKKSCTIQSDDYFRQIRATSVGRWYDKQIEKQHSSNN